MRLLRILFPRISWLKVQRTGLQPFQVARCCVSQIGISDGLLLTSPLGALTGVNTGSSSDAFSALVSAVAKKSRAAQRSPVLP